MYSVINLGLKEYLGEFAMQQINFIVYVGQVYYPSLLWVNKTIVRREPSSGM
jgi:hypothetical protein